MLGVVEFCEIIKKNVDGCTKHFPHSLLVTVSKFISLQVVNCKVNKCADQMAKSKAHKTNRKRL